MYNRNTEIDMESVAAFLQDTVEKIRSEKNPEVLDELKKVFKKKIYNSGKTTQKFIQEICKWLVWKKLLRMR